MAATSHIVYNPADGRLWSLAAQTGLYKERLPSTDTVPVAADRSYSITISNVTGQVVTINAGSGWTPAVGDYVYDTSTKHGMVVSVTSATVFTVDGTAPATGAATAYVAFQCDVKWSPRVADPSSRKHWIDGEFIFDNFVGVLTANYKIDSDLSATPTTIAESYTRDTSQSVPATGKLPATKRFLVPAAHARTTHLGAEIEISCCNSPFELTGLSVKFRPMRPRGVKR